MRRERDVAKITAHVIAPSNKEGGSGTVVGIVFGKNMSDRSNVLGDAASPSNGPT